MLLDLINLEKIRRAVLYIICIAISLWLQMMVFSRVTILGVKPFFLPVVVIAIGLWEGGVWGGALGLATGLYADLAMAESTVTFLVLFAFFGFFSGVLGEFVINRRFVSYMILAALSLLFAAACQIVPLWIFKGAALGGLLPVALLQSAWGYPLAVPAYFAAKAISGRRRLS